MGAGMDHDRIVVGKPLPFSIFTRDGSKLLLAQAAVVRKPDRSRDMLARAPAPLPKRPAGPARKGRGSGANAEEEEAPVEENPLDALHRDYEAGGDSQHLSDHHRQERNRQQAVSRAAHGVHGPSIIGHRAGACGQVARSRARGGRCWCVAPFPAPPGLSLHGRHDQDCIRTASASATCSSRRKWSIARSAARRAREVSVRAELQTNEKLPCVICDLSTGGARIAPRHREPSRSKRRRRRSSSRPSRC